MFKVEDIVYTSDIELEQKSNEERNWRNTELTEYVDHYQKPLVWESLNLEQQEQVKAYRQSLLDYPSYVNFPNIDRPIRPF